MDSLSLSPNYWERDSLVAPREKCVSFVGTNETPRKTVIPTRLLLQLTSTVSAAYVTPSSDYSV